MGSTRELFHLEASFQREFEGGGGGRGESGGVEAVEAPFFFGLYFAVFGGCGVAGFAACRRSERGMAGRGSFGDFVVDCKNVQIIVKNVDVGERDYSR